MYKKYWFLISNLNSSCEVNFNFVDNFSITCITSDICKKIFSLINQITKQLKLVELDISVKIESIFNFLSLEMIEAFYEDIVGHTYLNKLSFKWKKGTFSIINIKIKGMEFVKKALTEFLNYSMFPENDIHFSDYLHFE